MTVSVPDSGGRSLSEFIARRQRLKLTEWVESVNLDFMQGKGKDLFIGLPDEGDCAKSFDISNLEALSYLNFETHSGYLARVRVEAVDAEVNRKTDGYIVTKSKVLAVLKKRLQASIESELGFQIEDKDVYDVVKNYFLDRISSLEGTVLGRMCRLLMGICQVEKEASKSPLYGTHQYHETLEKRMMKQMNTFRQIDTEESSEKPHSSAGENRRAEDSTEWKEFEDKHKKSGAIPWEDSFRVMGAFFTVRILLRRELYGEVLLWADTVPVSNPDLEKVLEDCQKTADRLHARTGSIPPELNRAIAKIEQKISRGP